MSSGTRAVVGDAFRNISRAIDPKVFDRIKTLGMSPRQMEMNRRWSYYCCAQYDSRAADWDGTRHSNPVERESIAQAGFIPPGFYDAGGQMSELPLKFRRPSAPYHLCKVVVDRFTGLLFSERRHPKLDVQGDPLTEDFVNALVEVARLWPAMIQARKYGGATGSVALGFKFRDGVPLIEVHDPRWLVPHFVDRASLKLAALEKRYMYPVEVRNPETGLWVEQWYWYRRVIDHSLDVVFNPVLVEDGDEPDWERAGAAELVEHNFGFCPVVWLQNQPGDDDVDGEPDCYGIYDLTERIDAQLSQADRGTVANCDPTLVLEGIEDTEIPPMKKGSGSAIKLPKGTAKYLEISGSGPLAARDLAKELRTYALEVAQCVLDHPDVANRTATEVERVYSSMLAKADVLREQYGQRGVLPLLGMMLKAIRSMGSPRVEGEAIVRYAVKLPPRVEAGGELVERELGPGGALAIHWPGYFEPSLADAQAAATAAATAKASGLLDEENAAKFVSTFFHVDDVASMLDKVRQEQGLNMDAVSSPLLDQPDPESRAAEPSMVTPNVPIGLKFFQYEIEGGIVTINEVRASKGLPPKVDGDLTLPEYRAKYPAVFGPVDGEDTPPTDDGNPDDGG